MFRLLTATVLAAATGAEAAILEKDWLAPGDGLLTLDTTTGREWLDVPVTLLNQYGEPDVLDAFQSAVSELAPGERLEGFVLASAADLLELAESAGVDLALTGGEGRRQNALPVERMTDLLGPVRVSLNGQGVAGLLSDLAPPDPDGLPQLNLTGSVIYGYPSGPSFPDGRGVVQVETLLDVPYSTLIDQLGLYVYRPIPEPGCLVFVISCVVVAASSLRRGGSTFLPIP